MPIPVIFAEEDDMEVFGLTGLEIFGLTIDPRTGRIIREEALLAL